MAIGIDDIAVEAIGEVVEESAESVSGEILGDGIGDDALSTEGSLSPDLSEGVGDGNPEIIGDGVGDEALSSEGSLSPDLSEGAGNDNSEILGDGIGDDALSTESLLSPDLSGEAGNDNSEILGDGIGDDALSTESSLSPDLSEEAGNDNSEILGDGIGDDALSTESSLSPDLSEEAGNDNSEILGDGIGDEALSSEDSLSPDLSEGAGDGNSEIIGDGVGDDALSTEGGAELSEETVNPSNVMHQQNVEGDGLGENTHSESLDNSNENPSNSTNQKDVIGEKSLDSAKPDENNPDKRLQNENATDDNEKPYMKDGKLIPNNTYTLNGYEYHTDQYGRITHGEGKVSVNDSPRSSLPKIEGVKEGDDRGHIIAHVLGGADTEGNLVPMDSSLNRGEYKSMELSAKKALDEGKDVKLSVDIEYGDGKRPVSFTVTLEVDDDITVKKFYNNAQ